MRRNNCDCLTSHNRITDPRHRVTVDAVPPHRRASRRPPSPRHRRSGPPVRPALPSPSCHRSPCCRVPALAPRAEDPHDPDPVPCSSPPRGGRAGNHPVRASGARLSPPVTAERRGEVQLFRGPAPVAVRVPVPVAGLSGVRLRQGHAAHPRHRARPDLPHGHAAADGRQPVATDEEASPDSREPRRRRRDVARGAGRAAVDRRVPADLWRGPHRPGQHLHPCRCPGVGR